MRFAGEAWPFVVPCALAAAVLGLAGLGLWCAITAVAAVCLLLFFRIPRRRLAVAPGAVLAAANGRVTRVETIDDPEVGPGRWLRVVTFLSVFDVHVQRAPVGGKVIASRYRAGRKVAAFRADAGEVNESHLVVLEQPGGERLALRQIAGLVARRVVSYLAEGQRVEQGELIGLIKFGSRVDLYLPEAYRVTVTPGDRVLEGETVVAVAPDEQPATVAVAPGTGRGGYDPPQE